MRYRFGLMAGGLVCVALALIVHGSGVAMRSYMREAAGQAGITLRLAVSALDGHLRRFEALPALIADHENIKALIADPADPARRTATNLYLKDINALLKSSDIYVMTLDGMTIAASNFDGPASFVGENFSYRPYFQDAALGKEARFYALGTTSAKRGYYFSAPIDIDGSVRGVIVFKVDIDGIEASWGEGDSRIVVSDPQGIIFMTGTPHWLYKGLLPLTPERLASTSASRRYADSVLRELPVQRRHDGENDMLSISENGKEMEFLVLSQPMPEAGWTVAVMMDTASARAQAQSSIIVAVLLVCLVFLGIAILVQRRTRLAERIKLQAEAQENLERNVEERTADLARVNGQIKQEIAERRLTERRLRRTQADLIQAGKLAGLGQMSAALSHEFNQPLAAAKTYADSAALLIERGRSDEANDNLRRISALIDRMASISRHLRNFARKPEERLGTVSIDDVLRDTLEIVDVRLRAADATLAIVMDTPPPVVLGGAVRLQQVLVNIITNAADAVEGLDDRRIEVEAMRTGDGRVAITVRDHGPGVAPAIRERIFDPFYSTKGVGKGLGLGLSISYNIVKDFGGSLGVADHPEGGAVFTVELASAETFVGRAAE